MGQSLELWKYRISITPIQLAIAGCGQVALHSFLTFLILETHRYLTIANIILPAATYKRDADISTYRYTRSLFYKEHLYKGH